MNVKPCPCCGKDDAYVGIESADTVAVVCRRYPDKGCGLRMVVPFPDKTPKGCKTITQLEHYILRLAVKRWNRRA